MLCVCVGVAALILISAGGSGKDVLPVDVSATTAGDSILSTGSAFDGAVYVAELSSCSNTSTFSTQHLPLVSEPIYC